MNKRVTLTRPVYSRPGVTRRVVGVPAPEDQEKAAAQRVNGEGEIPPHRGGLPPQFSRTPVKEGKEVVQVASLLEQANQLTKTERQQLLDQLALTNQLTASAASNRDVEMWSQAITDALAEVIGGEAGGDYGVMLVKRVLGSTICWRPVERFMQSSKLAELRVVERQSIYHMLARLLVKHAAYVSRRSGAPLSPKLVGSCVGSLPGVFEQNFPGYLAAGLAPMVAKQMQAIR